MAHVEQSELGKKSAYPSQYNPDLLFPIPRQSKREEIGITTKTLPFCGKDAWTHYEVSWLNPNGKPEVAIAHIEYDCTSPNIIESKSMKLYFNSLNQTRFRSINDVASEITAALSKAVGVNVHISLMRLQAMKDTVVYAQLPGQSIDHLDVACHDYQPNPELLTVGNKDIAETLCSDLLKSNCLVTHQPDWGSVMIDYKGKHINHEGLLKYLVSFREHNEFHEQCVERIFMDITRQCQPIELTVYARYTRRGGLDINPCRSSIPESRLHSVVRLIRQ